MNILTRLNRFFFTATAIYIGEDFADVAQARLTLSGVQITLLERIPYSKTEEGLPQTDIIDRIDRIFASSIHDKDKKPYRIAVNISDKHLILRRFTIRDIPQSEIEQAVLFEAQKYIPCSIDSLIYGFKTYSCGNGFREIVFVATDTKNIELLVNYFKQKNILPSVIESVPILLARGINTSRGVDIKGAYILVHFEPPNKVILCEVSHGYPHFFKEVYLDDNKSENKDGEMNRVSLRDAWPSIEQEISRGIDYLKKETAETVEKIYVSGFSHSHDEKAAALDFGIPIERINISFATGVELEKKDRYTPVLMLIHDAIKKPFLNMSPKEIVSNDLWCLRSIIARMSIGILAIVLGHMIFMSINSAKSKEIDLLVAKHNIFNDISPKSPKSEVREYKDNVSQRISFINDLVSSKRSLTARLIELGDIMPPEAWIDSLSYSNMADESGNLSLTINGFIFGSSDGGTSTANKILEEIKDNDVIMGGFDEAELTSVQKKELFQREVAEFAIVLKTSGSKAYEPAKIRFRR